MARHRSSSVDRSAVILLIAQPGARKRVQTREAEHLQNIAADFLLWRDFFQENGRADVLAGSVYDAQLTRGACCQKVAASFKEPAAVYIIAYFGHGELGTGDWKLFDGTVKFEDVVKMWKLRQAASELGKATLVIYMDSCYSGNWVLQAQQRRLDDVVVQAACNSDEKAMDGRFTPMWIEFQGGATPETAAFRQLAPYAFTPVRGLRSTNQHPQVYRPTEASLLVGGSPLRLLDDGALSFGRSGCESTEGSPWWPWRRGTACDLQPESGGTSRDSRVGACETRQPSGSPSLEAPMGNSWAAEFLDPELHASDVARICKECFQHGPCGITPADLVYLYDAFDAALLEQDSVQNPLKTCQATALRFNEEAARSASPHRAVYARSTDGTQEAIVFNHRMPRGAVDPPRAGERLDSRQGPLLALYADLGALRHDSDVDHTQFQGPYVLRANQGLAVLRLAVGRHTKPDFAAEVLRTVTDFNVSVAHVPYPQYRPSDLASGRVATYMAYTASAALADVYRAAGYEIRAETALQELWPTRPPCNPWWRCHGHLVPAEPFLALRRVEPS